VLCFAADTSLIDAASEGARAEPTMHSLIYISRSLLTPANRAREIERILEAAHRRNRALGVTGALLFTGKNFAQVIEGDPDAVRRLMQSIRADPRHEDVRTVGEASCRRRTFFGWTMAYVGTATYVQRHIDRLLAGDAAGDPTQVAGLKRLIFELALADGVDDGSLRSA